MARPVTPHPTSGEFAVLQILWDRGPQTVRDVHERLSGDSGVSYTTVLKTLQIMLEKGLVTRDESQRSHLYAAAVTQQSARAQVLRRVLDMAFGGSIATLVQGAIQSKSASARELRAIRKLLEEHDS
jgi:BlaI family transcriptional regulator, penicillinase repressor